MSTRSSSPTKSDYPSEFLLTAVTNLKRWRILSEMISGELIPVTQLAKRIGDSQSNTSKHVAILVDARILQAGPGGLYRLADRFLSAVETRELDFGHVVLRIPSGRA